MIEIKRNETVGANGSAEGEFLNTIGQLKNKMGFQEVSRSGQASDFSLAIVLKYRDFPEMTLKMENSVDAKFRVVQAGIFAQNETWSTRGQLADFIMSDDFFFIWSVGSEIDSAVGMVKDSDGDVCFFKLYNGWYYVWAARSAMNYEMQARYEFLPVLHSKGMSGEGGYSAALVLDIFAPIFWKYYTKHNVRLNAVILGLKTVMGVRRVGRYQKFSVCGRKYMKIHNTLCAEVSE